MSSLLATIKELWLNEVSATLALDTIIQISREVAAEVTDASLWHEAAVKRVRATCEWRAAHDATVRDVYQDLYGDEAPASVLHSTYDAVTPDQIIQRVRGLVEARAPAPMAAPAPDESDAASDLFVDDSPEPAVAVDSAWLDAFAAAFHREPFVHEYVHLRTIQAATGATLADLAALHAERYNGMRQVHRDYLDEALEEWQFARRYVPAAYLEDDIVRRERFVVVESQGYADAMQRRLCEIHEVLYGKGLSAVECEHLFETHVRSNMLPLNTGQLNELVSAFNAETGEHVCTLEALWRLFYRREPEPCEITDRVHEFRIDADAAEGRVRYELSTSDEFKTVLADLITKGHPDMKRAHVFRLLARAKELDLAAITSLDALVSDLVGLASHP